MDSGLVVIKKDREGPLRGGNPWIFSQAIERVQPTNLAAGAWVRIVDHRGDLLGAGYYNANTTIALRVLAWGSDPSLEDLIAQRLHNALALRRRVVPGDTNCFRLLNGDGDGLSGVVVDVYGDVAVMQLLTAGAERMRESLIANLRRVLAPHAILERSQGAVRRQEGLADRSAVAFGEAVSETEAREAGFEIHINFTTGQKTGYFLDQRDNRRRFGGLAADARVLDAFCYGGGFSLAALAGGARAVSAVDSSTRALESARRNLARNGLADSRVDLVAGDAAALLQAKKAAFDLIVLDPPPLARSRKDVAHARSLYVTLNRLALEALAPGGSLMTFSCSTHFRGDDFTQAVQIAQIQAGRRMRVTAHLGPSPDHPVLLGHVEGEYLTGLLLAEL